MRLRHLVIFVLGFCTGAVSLAVGMWLAGSLPAPPAAVGTASRAMPGPEVPPPSLSDFSQPAPRPAASPLPPRDNFPAGEADRIAPPSSPKLAMPIAGVTLNQLTDNFNETRDGHPHEALDIPAPRGTPVIAVAQGNVVKLFHSKQGGITVYQFDDSGKWCYYYAHLDRY